MTPLRFRLRNLSDTERARYAGALRLLRQRGIRGVNLRTLIAKLEEEAERDRQVNAWPTAAEDRQALGRVANASAELVASLAQLSPRALAEFATATYEAFGRPVLDTAVSQAMQQLAHACNARVAKMPAQSRRESYPNVVRAAWRVAQPLGFALSPRAGTPFHDACRACFVLLDITGRPGRASKSTKHPRSADQVVDPTASIRKFRAGQKVGMAGGAGIS